MLRDTSTFFYQEIFKDTFLCVRYVDAAATNSRFATWLKNLNFRASKCVVGHIWMLRKNIVQFILGSEIAMQF